MSSKEIAEFLHNLELCEICVLRYTDKYTFNPNQNTSENAEIDHPKKKRTNYCVACLGLFEGIDFAADEIVTKSNLASYDSKSLYTSINVPIALLIRELSIWIALINQFPGSIDCGKSYFNILIRYHLKILYIYIYFKISSDSPKYIHQRCIQTNVQ